LIVLGCCDHPGNKFFDCLITHIKGKFLIPLSTENEILFCLLASDKCADKEVGGKKLRNYFRERGSYLDVFAWDFLGTSKNVPGAPARARQCRPTGRRAQGIFGAERPSTRPNEVVARAAGKTCCAKCGSRNNRFAMDGESRAPYMTHFLLSPTFA